jgi:F420 biosynthesis protein FbiB-like protein
MRRSIRRYLDQPVPPEIVDELLTAATTAPSPHHRQPWRFAVVRGASRERLAAAMGARLRADRLRDGDPPDVVERDAQRSFARITTAPVSLLACLSMADMDVYPDARRAAAERWMAGQAVACAVQNVLLAAAQRGLGACWMCAPLFCPDAARDALSLPADWEAQALVTLGWPADDGRPRARRPLADVVVLRD